MRAAGWVLPLLLAACNGDDEPAVTPAKAPVLKWGSVGVYGLKLWLPDTWTGGIVDYGPMGSAFLGPEEDGFKTVVILNRKPWDRGGDHWSQFQAAKFDNPKQTLFEVHERGWTTICGARARYLAYSEVGAGREVVTLDHYFWLDGQGYILRCTATRRTFAFRYRPIFNEIARRLAYPSR